MYRPYVIYHIKCMYSCFQVRLCTEHHAITHECELVARNSENAKVLELALECIHCEVLRRRLSERRHVDQ